MIHIETTFRAAYRRRYEAEPQLVIDREHLQVVTAGAAP